MNLIPDFVKIRSWALLGCFIAVCFILGLINKLVTVMQ